VKRYADPLATAKIPSTASTTAPTEKAAGGDRGVLFRGGVEEVTAYTTPPSDTAITVLFESTANEP